MLDHRGMPSNHRAGATPRCVQIQIFASLRMNYFERAVGNCPLLRIEWASRLTGCNVLAKAEYTNPGGSIKDRAALYARALLFLAYFNAMTCLPQRSMIKDAEAKGILVR